MVFETGLSSNGRFRILRCSTWFRCERVPRIVVGVMASAVPVFMAGRMRECSRLNGEGPSVLVSTDFFQVVIAMRIHSLPIHPMIQKSVLLRDEHDAYHIGQNWLFSRVRPEQLLLARLLSTPALLHSL